MDNLFAREWEVPWQAYVVPSGLVIVNVAAWLAFPGGDMSAWSLSWESIQRGRVLALLAHMFAHGGLIHLTLNMAALVLLGPSLSSRMGSPPLAWARFLYLYLGSGICGAVLFLALQGGTAASMLGASGAIFGLLGALARVHPRTGAAVAVRSERTWLLVKLFVQNHLALFALIVVLALFSGQSAGLAWQAHLGGLLFGFFAAPLYLPRTAQEGIADSELGDR